MRVIKYKNFNKNEGLKDSLSIIGILLSLGLTTPKLAYANKEKIESSFDVNDRIVLDFINYLDNEKPGDSVVDNKYHSISLLDNKLKDFNRINRTNIKLNDIIEKTKKSNNFPITLDLIFVQLDKQRAIATIDYKYFDKVQFMIVMNKAWDRNLYGFRINF
jgi:hypothetical protein